MPYACVVRDMVVRIIREEKKDYMLQKTRGARKWAPLVFYPRGEGSVLVDQKLALQLIGDDGEEPVIVRDIFDAPAIDDAGRSENGAG